MSRLFILTAGLALLIVPGIARALPPAAMSPPAFATGFLLAQAPTEPAAPVSTNAWASARLAEINAAIATLEEAAKGLSADARTRADAAVQSLRANRDAFQAQLAAITADTTQKTEAQLAESRAALEAQWTAFEKGLEAYLTTAQLALRSAVLQAREKAEETYWQQAIAKLRAAEEAIAAEKRPAIDSAIATLQSYVDAAKAKLEKLQAAGAQAWAALQDSMNDARRAFDAAYAGVVAVLDQAKQ